MMIKFLKGFLKGSRTRIVAGLHVLIGALMLITPDTLQMITSENPATRRFGALMIGQGVLIYVLRQITTSPAGKSI